MKYIMRNESRNETGQNHHEHLERAQAYLYLGACLVFAVCQIFRWVSWVSSQTGCDTIGDRLHMVRRREITMSSN